MKRITSLLSILLSASMLASLPASALSVGDPDENGIVDAVDAAQILVRSALLGVGNNAEADDYAVMDINADGIINANDAAYVLTYAAKAGASGNMPAFSDYVAVHTAAPEYEGAQYVSMILGDIYTTFSTSDFHYDPLHFVISSPDQLDSFVEKMHTIKTDFSTRTSTEAAAEWGVPLTDTVAKYDEAWFEDHSLIMVIAMESATDFYHNVQGITETEQGIWQVQIDRIVPMASGQTLPSFAIFVETNKAADFAPEIRIEMTNVYEEWPTEAE